MGLFTPDKDITKLDKRMIPRIEKYLSIMEDDGFPVFVTEGRRTKLRQMYNYSMGRYISRELEMKYLGYDSKDIYSRPKKRQVTWTLNSKHIQGLAVDIAFKTGKLYPDITTKEGNFLWTKAFNNAEKCGLKSLYRETGLMDLPHLEFDENWQPEPEKHWAYDYETVMQEGGLLKYRKELEKAPTWGALFKFLVLSNPNLKKKFKELRAKKK